MEKFIGSVIAGMFEVPILLIQIWVVNTFAHTLWSWGLLDLTWIGKAIGSVTCGG